MSLSVGKIPFIHVGNQVVSELGPIVQFTKAKVSNTNTDTEDVTKFITSAYSSDLFKEML